jgi:tetratricopeptide (TPR) repeat protein
MKIKMTRTKWIVSSILFLIVAYLIFISIIGGPAKLGKIYYVKGNYEEAVYFYNIAIRKAKEKKNLKELAELNRELGLTYLEKGELKKAKEYVNKALEMDLKLYGENNINTLTNELYLTVFEYKKDKTKTNETIQSYENIINKAYNIKNKNEDYYRFMGECYRSISAVYVDIKQIDDAIKFIEKAIKMDEKILESKNISIVDDYNILGSLYISKNEEEKGLYYFEKALEAAKKNNISNEYQTVKDVQKAIALTSETFKYKDKLLTDIKQALKEKTKEKLNNE